MRPRVIPLLVVVGMAGVVAAAERSGIRIESPRPGSLVDWREMVTGPVADKSAEVWLIIHPRATRVYWVQPPAAYDREHGRWFVEAYFGRQGMDRGARFDVAAVVNPRSSLREGMQLRGWPRAAAISPLIVVTRR